MNNFGTMIESRRKEMQLTLRHASEQSGISQATLWRLERGIYDPRLSTVMRVAEWLHIPRAEALELACFDVSHGK